MSIKNISVNSTKNYNTDTFWSGQDC